METRIKKYAQKREEIKREANQLEYLTKSEYEQIFNLNAGNPMEMLDEMMESLYEEKRKRRI